MKTIFKMCLVAVALLTGINTYAQDKPITFGVKAGVNLSNASGEGESADAKIGFNVGVTLDYGFTPDIYLLTGLQLTTKGYTLKEENEKITSNMMYLQLPVHVGYKLTVAEATKIVFHAGPYVAYGIGGKTDGVKSFQDGAYKKFDFGVGLGVGAEFGKIGVDLGYDFGLANINDTNVDGKIKNQNAYLTVGYKF
ncbi:MAG: PorT family protein [Prevotella sp.]|jgi:hypothetical protein|nr:PorT family protein [Prevotella sp.]